VATGDKLIQVKDLKKYYNRGAIKALDGVTVDIYRGDVMWSSAPPGSGAGGWTAPGQACMGLGGAPAVRQRGLSETTR